MVTAYWSNMLTMLGYVLILLLICPTTALIALFCSVIFRRTSVAMMTAYLVVVLLFTAPLAASYFADLFLAPQVADNVRAATVTSPFAAAFALPLDIGSRDFPARPAQWEIYSRFVLFYAVFDLVLVVTMIWLFQRRWRVAQ
jgi:hypothetical protein